IEAGLGGAVIEDSRLVLGAAGTAGEFGHMPFGDPAQPCRCGARGCWNTAIEGAALARLLNQPPPADEVSYARKVFVAAQASLAPGAPRRAELDAVQAVARSIGAGAAGLANALDPSIITLGGLGRDLLDIAADQVHPAYLAGLMQFLRASPPPPRPFGCRRPPGRPHRGALPRRAHRPGPARLGLGQAATTADVSDLRMSTPVEMIEAVSGPVMREQIRRCGPARRRKAAVLRALRPPSCSCCCR